MNKDQLNRNIFKIAIPTIVGYLGVIAFEWADIYWIGKINPKAVASVGAAAFLEWTIFALMALTCTGCATLVSQYFGGGKTKSRYDVIRESFWLSIIISIFIIILLVVFTPTIFHFMGLDSFTYNMAMEYFNILIWGLPVLYILNLQGHIFNAYGDTKTSTIIMLICLLLNAVLDPILIFGWLGLPELGIKGASIATVISEFLGILLRLYYLRKKKYIDELNTFAKFSLDYFLKILRIGVPSSITNLVWTIVFPLLTVIITKFGMAPLAGLNIGNRIEGIPYFFSIGFSVAVGTLVGQSFGRGDKEEVWKILKRGLSWATIILLPACFLFIFFPEKLIGLLNDDAEIIRNGSNYLRIIGYFELFMGWELVIEGAFNGLGNTKPYMMIRVPLTLARIPIAYILAIYFNWGVNGVWWAVSLTTLAKGIGLLIVFLTSKTNKKLLSLEEALPQL